MTTGNERPLPSSETNWRGFAAPQSADGRIALYGPPPWTFEGYAASVFLKFDPARVQHLIPSPLKLAGDPVARLSVHDIVCDYGLGLEFVQKNPDQARFGEAVVGFLVEYKGVVGQWCPYLWCTTDAEFAVGREFYGWPQRIGAMSLTRQPFRGWRKGDRVTGVVARGQRSVFAIGITLEHDQDLPDKVRGVTMYPPQAAANQHYTMTALPDPVTPATVRRRLFRTPMHQVVLQNTWSGSGEVRVTAPELQILSDAEALGGRWSVISWVKPYPEDLLLEEAAPA